jgi:hypothetical protein
MKTAKKTDELKDLRLAVGEMRSVARKLAAWADRMEQSLLQEPNKELPAEPAPASPAENPEDPAPAEAPVKAPEVSFQDLQGRLADLCAAGKADRVRQLILSFGVRKLSDLDPSHYAALFAAAADLFAAAADQNGKEA